MPRSVTLLFRERIRELRRLRNWTQAEAAEVCGLGDKMFQQYEAGIKTNPGLQTLEKISRGFGVEVHDLFAPELSASTVTAMRNTKSKRRKTVR